jgi:hypothetical protein
LRKDKKIVQVKNYQRIGNQNRPTAIIKGDVHKNQNQKLKSNARKLSA